MARDGHTPTWLAALEDEARQVPEAPPARVRVAQRMAAEYGIFRTDRPGTPRRLIRLGSRGGEDQGGRTQFERRLRIRTGRTGAVSMAVAKELLAAPTGAILVRRG